MYTIQTCQLYHNKAEKISQGKKHKESEPKKDTKHRAPLIIFLYSHRCLTFLLRCVIKHRVLSNREIHPNLNSQSFYWGLITFCLSVAPEEVWLIHLVSDASGKRTDTAQIKAHVVRLSGSQSSHANKDIPNRCDVPRAQASSLDSGGQNPEFNSSLHKFKRNQLPVHVTT